MNSTKLSIDREVSSVETHGLSTNISRMRGIFFLGKLKASLRLNVHRKATNTVRESRLCFAAASVSVDIQEG